jgi:hypothetical protein
VHLWIAGAALGAGLIVTSAAAAGTPNISGVWNVQGQAVYGARIVSVSPTCTFRQAAGQLSGECVGPNARGPLTGLIAGHNVSWTWRNVPTTAVGINGETGFNGVYVDAHLIRGTMTSTAIPGTGTFTQTR